MEALALYIFGIFGLGIVWSAASPQHPDRKPVLYSRTFDNDPVPGGRSG